MKGLEFKYKTSTDYGYLYELVQEERVVCIVTRKHKLSNGKTFQTKEVASSSFDSTAERIDIGSQGYSYFTAHSHGKQSAKEQFIALCKEYNLEFIRPDSFEAKWARYIERKKDAK